MRKLITVAIAIAGAVYAAHGIIVGDLVMPYRVGSIRQHHFGHLHLRGIWAIGAAACLLLGAAGLAIQAFCVIGTNPKVDPQARFYRNLAIPLMLIGAALILGLSQFGGSLAQ